MVKSLLLSSVVCMMNHKMVFFCYPQGSERNSTMEKLFCCYNVVDLLEQNVFSLKLWCNKRSRAQLPEVCMSLYKNIEIYGCCV